MDALKPTRLMPLQMLLILIFILSTALLSGWFLYDYQISKLKQSTMLTHEDQVHQATSLLNSELGKLRDVLRLLHVDSLLNQGLHNQDPIATEKISLVFSRFGRVVSDLMQIRWLDEHGMERVRVDIRSDGTPVTVSQPALQNKQGRYYVVEAMQTALEEVYLSSIDLNEERGQIVIPFQPTIRAALRTGGEDKLHPGLLIINYNLGPLLKKISALSTPFSHLQLVDEQGQWLFHPDPEKNWGQQRAQPQNNLTVLDANLWHQLQNNRLGITQNMNGAMVSFREIALLEGSSSNPKQLFLVVSTSAKLLNKHRVNAFLKSVALSAILALIGGLMLLREYQTRTMLIQMALLLKEENCKLKRLNTELDISLRQQQALQDELVESRKLSALGMMGAGIAHELNTPIGGALLTITEQQREREKLAQVMQQGLTRSALLQYLERSHTGLDIAHNNLSRASELVSNFKRMTFERMQDEPDTVSVAQVVNDLVHALQHSIKGKHINIINSVPDKLRIQTYPGVLSQVLQNLISNAISHGIGARIKGEIVISAREAGQRGIEITVADNGAGIPEELIDSLFDPFVTSGRDNNHTGLGLHFVYLWVTNQLKGRIICDQPAESGACFTLQLPHSLSSSKAVQADQEQSETADL